MLQTRVARVTGGRAIVRSLRFESLFVLAVGVLLPTLLAFAWHSSTPAYLLVPEALSNFLLTPTTFNSLCGAAAAALATNLSLRRLERFPGFLVVRSVLPVLAACYAGFIAALLLLRFEYSNLVLVTCFVGTLVARFAIASLHRTSQTIYGIVPGGEAAQLYDLCGRPAIALQSPKLDECGTNAIVADLHAELGDEWERFLAEAAISGVPVYHYKQVWEAHTGMVRIDHLSENSLGALVPGFTYPKIKRLVDLALCILVLPLILPLMAACALLIKLDSPGPIFFLQRRMGYRGKIFNVVKFRTMTVLNDGGDRDASVTISDDARITRSGRWMRRCRLDELPQWINILRGEMSWIGPRPEAVGLSSWYQDEIPFYRYRHIVRPGITGWAQVNQGHVSSLEDIDHKLQYDFYYIKYLSYWLDIIIAIRTIRVVLTGFGAK